MNDGFEEFGSGRYGPWHGFGGFTTRVHITGEIGINPETPATLITAEVEYLDENLRRRTKQFGPRLTRLLRFDFWAGQDDSATPQMHGPKIRIQAVRGAP